MPTPVEDGLFADMDNIKKRYDGQLRTGVDISSLFFVLGPRLKQIRDHTLMILCLGMEPTDIKSLSGSPLYRLHIHWTQL